MGTNYLHGLVNQPVFLRNEPTLGGPTIRNDSKVLLSPVESMTIIGSDKGALNRSKTGNDFNTFNLSKSGISLFQSYIQNKRNRQTPGLRSPSPLFEKTNQETTKSFTKLCITAG